METEADTETDSDTDTVWTYLNPATHTYFEYTFI